MIQDLTLQNTLKLLAVSLSGAENNGYPDLSLWNGIKKELESQAVLPIVSDYIMQSDICDEEKIALTKNTAVNILTFHKIMSEHKKLVNIFSDNSIPFAVMKGASAAQYYPKPALRQFGDIDILVLPEDYSKAFQILADFGYKNEQELDTLYKRHIGFKSPSGIEVELHRYFSSSSNKEQNDLFDGWLYEKLNTVEKKEVNGYEVPMFPVLENGLILLGHINQHLGTGLGLRQIIDWMMYVQAELNDDFWNTKFKEKAEAIGMDTLAKTVTKMCQIYLSLSKEFTWCYDADEKLAEGLILYILKAGNFGTKIERDSRRTVSVLLSCSNPIKAFRYLTNGGMVHMTEAGLKPVKAFAWIYQIGHLIHMAVKHLNYRDFKKDVKTNGEVSNLLNRLKVTRF